MEVSIESKNTRLTTDEVERNIYSYNQATFGVIQRPDDAFIFETRNLDLGRLIEDTSSNIDSNFGYNTSEWAENKSITVDYHRRPSYRNGKNRFEGLSIKHSCLANNNFQLTFVSPRFIIDLIYNDAGIVDFQRVDKVERLDDKIDLEREIKDIYFWGLKSNEYTIRNNNASLDAKALRIKQLNNIDIPKRIKNETTAGFVESNFESSKLVETLKMLGFLDDEGKIIYFEGTIKLSFVNIIDFHSHNYEFWINDSGNLSISSLDDEQKVFSPNYIQNRIYKGSVYSFLVEYNSNGEIRRTRFCTFTRGN